MLLSDKEYLQILKDRFFDRILAEWAIKWKNDARPVYPTDFNAINLKVFVEALIDDINEVILPKDVVLDKKKFLVGDQTLRRLLENPTQETRFQNTTRNGLARYVGADDWSDFCKRIDGEQALKGGKKLSENKGILLNPDSDKEYFNTKPSGRKHFYLSIALALSMLGIGILFFVNFSKSSPKKYPKNAPIRIIEATNSQFAPTTITFAYDISGYNFDSAFINYDGTKRLITKPKDTLSITYLYPSVQRVYVRLDTMEYKIFAPIKSQKWIANFNNGIQLPNNLFSKKGFLHVAQRDLPLEILNSKEYYTFYQKCEDYNVDADSAVFETRVKNPESEGGISCFDVSIGLMGETDGKLMYSAFNILHPSCTQYIHVNVGNTDIGYRANIPPKPLSPLGIDISDWTVIKSVTKNNVFKVYADNKLVYSIPYSGKIGRVKLIQIQFKGSGSIDYIKLGNSWTGKNVYFEDFND